MFPVYIYDEQLELPTEGNYFLVSGNGLWLHKDTGIVRAFVPVDNISVLQDLDAKGYVQCGLPKLPAEHVWRIKTFFKKVVEKHRSEASTSLYFNKTTGEFRIHVPEQKVSHGGVNYKRQAMSHQPEMEGFLCVGTIHSHCDFGAFHSGTDIGDEEDFDGLHCTFGHNNLDEFSISASIVVNGFRVKVDPLSVLEGIEPAPDFGDGRYRLPSLAPELEEQWSTGLEGWMENVRGMYFGGYGTWGVAKFFRGDKVKWAGDLSTVTFKTTCGDGPFEVDSAEDGKITIVTKVGLAKFSDKLFERVS